VSEGDMLADKYRVERVLGAGGMGVVVAARHLQLDQRVAIKFLLPEALGNAEVVERFAREARAAVEIQSEHVARIIDVGELEDGAPYIVMEYLEGSDLADLSRRRGPLPLGEAVLYVLEGAKRSRRRTRQGFFGLAVVGTNGSAPTELDLQRQEIALRGVEPYASGVLGVDYLRLLAVPDSVFPWALPAGSSSSIVD
jgi:serine/threonine protein kinase